MPPWLFGGVRGRLRSSSAPIVWDIDDAVWIGRAGAGLMARQMCHLADHVVAGNRLLASWAESNGASAVTVIPTCFDAQASISSSFEGSTLNLVWIGSPATAVLLDPFASALLEALRTNRHLSIEFVGGREPALLAGHDRVRCTAWSPAAERNALARAHFGLALQPRTEYNDHKCGFKIVKYLAHGVIPIASDGPVHRDIVGQHGYLIQGTRLADALETPPTSRQRAAAIEYHRREFSVERATSGWAELLGGAHS